MNHPHTERPRGFRCRLCGMQYGDSLYTGPFGHAPNSLCLDCWASHWQLQVHRMHTGGNCNFAEEALALLCAGYTYRESAEILQSAPSTVRRAIRNIARNWADLPEWFRRRIEKPRLVRHVA